MGANRAGLARAACMMRISSWASASHTRADASAGCSAMITACVVLPVAFTKKRHGSTERVTGWTYSVPAFGESQTYLDALRARERLCGVVLPHPLSPPMKMERGEGAPQARRGVR
ncbi:MAG: hypothetical protein Kow00120_13020 [Anaerolineae bacterium]